MLQRRQPRRRELNAEAAALACFAAYVERSLVPHEHVLDDRQAEPRAAGFARAAAVDTIEAFREPRDVFRLDADPGVLDGELAALCARSPAQTNLAALRSSGTP